MHALSACILLFIVPGIAAAAPGAGPEKVELIRAPDGGIQPRSVIDEAENLHLIYYVGDPMAGDVFYVRRRRGAEAFSKPLRVNSRPGSAIAAGNVRGAHLALGKGGRVHVAWMGSKTAQPRGPAGATPMLYARMNDAGTAFEPQRNVLQFAAGLDGGGSVAADKSGRVYVSWHAGGEGEGDAARRVWVTRSADEGRTFTREVPASDQALGACGCCGMRAFAAEDGTLFILYRAAAQGVDRDMYLLTSRDGGRRFGSARVHPWKLESCPMSTAAFGESGGVVSLTWETAGQVYYSSVDALKRMISPPVSAPGEGVRRKHPSVTGNARGETLLIWTEGMGWKKGGALAWQIFDRAGRAVAGGGQAEGVPAWSLITAYARPDGGFTIIY